MLFCWKFAWMVNHLASLIHEIIGRKIPSESENFLKINHIKVTNNNCLTHKVTCYLPFKEQIYGCLLLDWVVMVMVKTLEVRSDKGKPGWTLFQQHSASLSINQHQSESICNNLLSIIKKYSSISSKRALVGANNGKAMIKPYLWNPFVARCIFKLCLKPESFRRTPGANSWQGGAGTWQDWHFYVSFHPILLSPCS